MNGEYPAERPRRRYLRALSPLVVLSFAITQLPVVSAHGTTATAGLTQLHGILLTLVGIVATGSVVFLKRTNRVTPTYALFGVFIGLAVTVVGVILFESLSPEPAYAASAIPFPRSWYRPMALGAGMMIAILSFAIGLLRWPARPRYTFLGLLLGVWVAYPYLIPGTASDSHPLGYALVVGTPVLIGYILWTDAGNVLRTVLRDSVVRRFVLGITVLMAFFFVSVTGYLSFFLEEGVPHETTVVVLPTIYQIVTWPTLEIALPHIPLFLAISPGQIILVGTLSVLIGLNAALVARYWRVDENAGLTEETVGSAAVVGSCTCGCCGPLVAKIALLSVGPSVAAPLYWLFIDSASPLGSLFLVGALLLFTGSIIHSIAPMSESSQSPSVAPAD